MSEKRDKWGGGGLRVLAFVLGGAFAFWAARSRSRRRVRVLGGAFAF